MKILVVDDHALVREGLHQVLKGLDESVEVLQAQRCDQAFALAAQHSDIDLVLLDYHMPDMNGLQALEVFGQEHPELPIIVISGTDSTHAIRQMLQVGASGFVSKSSMSDELLTAVRTVLQGDIYEPPELLNSDHQENLTQRQIKVLQLLLDGLSNKDIAERLFISEETVKSHVAAILRHFDVQNRTQAVVAAARSGYMGLN
ncbi:response regulator transcription factor [Curvibacter sp. CHRR-16]|uniref:response regulator transcription factor n=1 Tax=Curvibacter sp. CHRR-16 TaxID=2835872 RepID=UPI0032EA3630